MERNYVPISYDLFVPRPIPHKTRQEYHTHNVYEIFFFLQGKVRFYVEYSCFKLNPGNIVLIGPQESHRVELEEDTVYERFAVNVSHKFIQNCATVQTDLLDRLFNRPFGRPHILETNEKQRAELKAVFGRLLAGYYQDDFGKDVLCSAYMMEILVRLNRLILDQGNITLPNTMPELVKQTLRYISDHLPNYITLEELSKELYHNSTYISRKFKAVTGFSIQEYILRKRLYLAQSYLLKGYSVGDSAMKAGFGDHSNFTRTFTKYVGCTPKKYQKGELNI